MTENKVFDRIILVSHNFKAFTIQYWNGSIYTDFSTAINESTNTDSTSEFTFNEVTSDKIRIIITGTQVADEDKSLKQLLILKNIGQLSGWPEIIKPTISKERKITKLISGKVHINKQLETFSCSLRVKNWNIDADLDIIEEIYSTTDGVLMWINAGDDTQFSRTHIGYRSQDIFLVSPTNEYQPEFVDSFYGTGIKLDIRLSEVIS